MSAVPNAVAADEQSGDEQFALASWLSFIERQHLRLGGARTALPGLNRAAAAVWQAALQGDVCIPIDAAGDLPASPLIGHAAGTGVTPLVFDAGYLYLQRLWFAEKRLAERLRSLHRAAPIAAQPAIDAAISAMNAMGSTVEVDPLQLRAIRTALDRGLAVISGGPGTGKTFTLAQLLVSITRLAPAARIAVAAPTGKAAARLSEALRDQWSRLGTVDPSLRDRLTVSTLHRLLGARGPGRGYHWGGARRLPYEVIVVDEASMMDLEMARQLAEAVAGDARLVLAGDRDQLWSVEPGNVFFEIIAAGDSALRGAVVVLERNYRQADAPGLTALSQQVRLGQSIDDAGYAAVRIVEGAAGGALQTAIVADAVRRYDGPVERLITSLPAFLAQSGSRRAVSTAFSAGESNDRLAAALLHAFGTFRVLAAMREGPVGVARLNRLIDARLRRRLGASANRPWYPGRLVLVTRNAFDLSNGDIGLCLPIGGHLAVAFPVNDGIRWVPVAQMPASEDAWVLTIHKSQGSEFHAVSLVLAPAGHRLNSRELVYTGVTRARAELTIWGGLDALNAAIRRPVSRQGRLADRLAG